MQCHHYPQTPETASLLSTASNLSLNNFRPISDLSEMHDGDFLV